MLFIESRKADKAVESGLERAALLDKLYEKGLTPLIRSARLHACELALPEPESARELERQVAAWNDAEGESAPYVRGDVFCSDDYTLFLIFGDTSEERGGGGAALRAGIVYRDGASNPRERLEAFCRSVDEALASVRRRRQEGAGGTDESGANGSDKSDVADGSETSAGDVAVNGWHEVETRVPASLARGAETSRAAGSGGAANFSAPARVTSLLDDAETRKFLQRLIEAQGDGRAAGESAATASGAGGVGEMTTATANLVSRLSEAGLVRREVLVSCRKTNRALFRLPSAEALSVINASHATCTECGAAASDERAEELVKPSELAAKMLGDGVWMTNRLRALLRGLGVPEDQLRINSSDGRGDSYVLANVSGELFLFVPRDGDVSASDARRALELEAETGAAHVAIVATGEIHADARARLREHARRRGRGGRGGGGEVELLLIEGLESAPSELQAAFERVSERMLAEELYELDASLGLSVGHLVAARFRLLDKSGALRDLAASAAGAVAGSLQEI